MQTPGWFAEIDNFESCRTIQANDGVVWAVFRSSEAWWYQERGGAAESFGSLTALLQRLSPVQRGLFGTTPAEAKQQDAVTTLIALLEDERRVEALDLLCELVEPSMVACCPRRWVMSVGGSYPG